MLLGSPPDMVHGNPLRKTVPSTLLTRVRRYRLSPGVGIHSCYSGLQVTGHRYLPELVRPCHRLAPMTKYF